MQIETITASDMQLNLPDLLTQIETHELDRIAITRQGRVVAVLVASDQAGALATNGYGCMAGTVMFAEGADLTDTTGDLSEFDAFHGKLHN